MNSSLHALAAVLVLVALSGCDQREPGDATSADPASVPSAPSDRSPATENDLAPVAVEHADAAAPTPVDEAAQPAGIDRAPAFDAPNSSFSLDGRTVVLKDGISQVPAAPGSASSITTRYVGREARGDLTRDGKDDVAYFVTREGGGSGRFDYVVVAINRPNGYRTTNAFLVGDRIDPQSLRISSSELQVTFRNRAKGEPMTTPPTRDSVLMLKVTPSGVLEGLMK